MPQPITPFFYKQIQMHLLHITVYTIRYKALKKPEVCSTIVLQHKKCGKYLYMKIGIYVMKIGHFT